MKTAIEIIKKEIAELWSSPGDDPNYTQIFEVIERNESLFKQQIIKSYDDAFNYVVGGGFIAKTGDQYFEEVYGTTNKEPLKDVGYEPFNNIK